MRLWQGFWVRISEVNLCHQNRFIGLRWYAVILVDWYCSSFQYPIYQLSKYILVLNFWHGIQIYRLMRPSLIRWNSPLIQMIDDLLDEMNATATMSKASSSEKWRRLEWLKISVNSIGFLSKSARITTYTCVVISQHWYKGANRKFLNSTTIDLVPPQKYPL